MKLFLRTGSIDSSFASYWTSISLSNISSKAYRFRFHLDYGSPYYYGDRYRGLHVRNINLY